MNGCLVLAELKGRQALAGLDAGALWRSDGAQVGAFDGLDGAALWRSGESAACAFDGAAQRTNGAVDPEASGELDGEVLLMSGEAAFGAETLLKNAQPWICVFGGAFLKRSSGHGLVASAGASQQMSGGPGIVATG